MRTQICLGSLRLVSMLYTSATGVPARIWQGLRLFTFLPFDTMSASRPGTPSFLRDNNDPPTYDFRRMDYYLDASQGHEPESTVIERSVAYIVSMPRSGTKVMRNSSHFASLLHGCAWFDLPGSCRLSFFFGSRSRLLGRQNSLHGSVGSVFVFSEVVKCS